MNGTRLINTVETYSEEERRVLSRFFTNTDKPVFALINLPEVVKGALFARYSRTNKPLRRLFLDEFLNVDYALTQDMTDQSASLEFQLPLQGWDTKGLYVSAKESSGASPVNVERAEQLYARVLDKFGDDSVAQLGAAHVACERSSNILTKVLERGRLSAYLEQSTRYILFNQKMGGNYLYIVPREIVDMGLEQDYRNTMDHLFQTYSIVVEGCKEVIEKRFTASHDSSRVRKFSIRAMACDAARGLLPASVLSNVGIFASGQAFAAMLVRMNAHPLDEVRHCARAMLEELNKVIPSFLRNVEMEQRGMRQSEYEKEKMVSMRQHAETLLGSERKEDIINNSSEVELVDWDDEGELKTVAAALYEISDLPYSRLLDISRRLSPEQCRMIISNYCGDRINRRHKPGRAFESTQYRFDVLSDYGSFRDLQRHRMLTIEWQLLSTKHGYAPASLYVEEAGLTAKWNSAMESAAGLWEKVVSVANNDKDTVRHVAQYVVPFAYRLRYSMLMNARESMHVIELRSSPNAHPDYSRICREMHRLIKDKAGHYAIADAMRFVGKKDTNEAGRLQEARRLHAKKKKRGNA